MLTSAKFYFSVSEGSCLTFFNPDSWPTEIYRSHSLAIMSFEMGPLRNRLLRWEQTQSYLDF